MTTADVTYQTITADEVMIDPRLFLNAGARDLWECVNAQDVVSKATALWNKQSGILIETVHYDEDGQCSVLLGFPPEPVTLADRPELLAYLLDRASTPWLRR